MGHYNYQKYPGLSLFQKIVGINVEIVDNFRNYQQSNTIMIGFKGYYDP